MTKREAIWILWGLGIGAVTGAVIVFGFELPAHPYDGRLGILMLAGAGLAYRAAKIAGTSKPIT